jgi:general L-amino acid transport system permease protein
MPQALRAVIPAMVGQFISLFKDTSLLAIIGVAEFLQIATIANTQQDFLGKGLQPITYTFVAVGYWAFAYTMSKESRRLETRLGVGTR